MLKAHIFERPPSSYKLYFALIYILHFNITYFHYSGYVAAIELAATSFLVVVLMYMSLDLLKTSPE